MVLELQAGHGTKHYSGAPLHGPWTSLRLQAWQPFQAFLQYPAISFQAVSCFLSTLPAQAILQEEGSSLMSCLRRTNVRWNEQPLQSKPSTSVLYLDASTSLVLWERPVLCPSQPLPSHSEEGDSTITRMPTHSLQDLCSAHIQPGPPGRQIE